MIKSLLYKEWLKVRWSFIGFLMLNLLAVINICVPIYNDFKFYKANEVFGGVVSWGYIYYIDLMYIPLATGILLAIVQFFPELNSNRLKLSLHLPMKESKSLLSMQWFGLLLLICIFLVDSLIIGIFSSGYFPSEVIRSYLIVSLPWFLAGFTGYIFISIIFIEPSWSRRIMYLVVGAGFVALYYDTFTFMGFSWIFSKSYPYFILITILLSPIILFSGNNYKRGIK
jgi:hypothetical protein